ncbi:UNVERIFIED_CONTAM: hypothetical protein K2H54_060258 [Gekko kuhli]
MHMKWWLLSCFSSWQTSLPNHVFTSLLNSCNILRIFGGLGYFLKARWGDPLHGSVLPCWMMTIECFIGEFLLSILKTVGLFTETVVTVLGPVLQIARLMLDFTSFTGKGVSGKNDWKKITFVEDESPSSFFNHHFG